MPLLDITNPKIINSLLENYEKEIKIRMRWLDRHQDRLQECATFKSEVKGYGIVDINKVSMIAGMATISRDHIAAKGHRKKDLVRNIHKYYKIELDSDNPSEFKKRMMPVKEDIKMLLLESKKKYLKERYKMGPEDKYYFLESTNWKYGWKLNDSELKLSGPLYGKVSHLQHELQSSIGPQPDPVHYGSPSTNYTLCSKL